jgi:hypoxanthine phosphoribosyltransferase
MSGLAIAEWIAGVVGGLAAIFQFAIWTGQWLDSRLYGFSAVERHGVTLLDKIRQSSFKPDFVLGIGRSGAFLGGWLAGNLGSWPIEAIERFHSDDAMHPIDYPGGEGKIAYLKSVFGEDAKVLIVEGATTTGNTLRQCAILIQTCAPKWDCRYCVLYEVEVNKFPVNYVGRRLKKPPFRYPWHKTSAWKMFIRSGDA